MTRLLGLGLSAAAPPDRPVPVTASAFTFYDCTMSKAVTVSSAERIHMRTGRRRLGSAYRKRQATLGA